MLLAKACGLVKAEMAAGSEGGSSEASMCSKAGPCALVGVDWRVNCRDKRVSRELSATLEAIARPDNTAKAIVRCKVVASRGCGNL